MDSRFSQRIKKLTDSTVEKTLKLASKPEVISLAGGIPNADLFPLKEIDRILSRLIKKQGKQVLQYNQTAGLPKLRELIADWYFAKWQKKVESDQVLITTGSQQGLDLLGKAFLDKDDEIVVEDPTYLVAINAFNGYEVRYETVKLNNNGIDVGQLEGVLTKKTKFIYCVPTFQNPSGVTWSEKVRDDVVKLIKKNNIYLVEDDPYSELYFDERPPMNLAGDDHQELVIYLGTFSKTFCPGLRVGYVIASKEIIKKLTLIKQGMDLHSPTLSQAIIYEYLKDKKNFNIHLKKIRDYYKDQCRHMLLCLEKYLQGKADWIEPKGGLFIWLTIKGIDCRKLYMRAVDAGLAFMPGYPFYASQPKDSTLRLTFATVSKMKIEKGIKILSEII
jgi:2-aminoadipate transaminase